MMALDGPAVPVRYVPLSDRMRSSARLIVSSRLNVWALLPRMVRASDRVMVSPSESPRALAVASESVTVSDADFPNVLPAASDKTTVSEGRTVAPLVIASESVTVSALLTETDLPEASVSVTVSVGVRENAAVRDSRSDRASVSALGRPRAFDATSERVMESARFRSRTIETTMLSESVIVSDRNFPSVLVWASVSESVSAADFARAFTAASDSVIESVAVLPAALATASERVTVSALKVAKDFPDESVSVRVSPIVREATHALERRSESVTESASPLLTALTEASDIVVVSLGNFVGLTDLASVNVSVSERDLVVPFTAASVRVTVSVWPFTRAFTVIESDRVIVSVGV